jgi:hydrogenase expression/formation protein HypE
MKLPDKISLDQGSGGLASQHLISDLFLKYFTSPALHDLEDCALLENQLGRLAMSTDSYVVDPLFFPGGNIGELAVHGTINDLAMRGAVPAGLSLGLIIEEGFAVQDLEKIISSIAAATDHAGVDIVTGDTKVVPRGKADKIFINTTGVGFVPNDINISGRMARPGDAVLISGTVGDHGITIMANQAGLTIGGDIKSDTMALHRMVAAMLAAVSSDIHVLRDPTRGGLATTLCEIAISSRVSITINEEDIPVRPTVAAACELIGLDPLYLANEGKCIVICKQSCVDQTLARMRSMAEGREAAVIGRVEAEQAGRVVLTTRIGGSRLIEPLTGQPLPRIC